MRSNFETFSEKFEEFTRNRNGKEIRVNFKKILREFFEDCVKIKNNILARNLKIFWKKHFFFWKKIEDILIKCKIC